jgi:hypothetical protein
MSSFVSGNNSVNSSSNVNSRYTLQRSKSKLVLDDNNCCDSLLQPIPTKKKKIKKKEIKEKLKMRYTNFVGKTEIKYI